MKKYFPFLVLLFLFAACSKKKDPRYVYLDAFTKDHFYFKPGSYWIYRDSISGRVDSFYVSSSNVSTLFSSNSNIVNEELKVLITQKSTNLSIKSEVQWYYTFRTYTQMSASYVANDIPLSLDYGAQLFKHFSISQGYSAKSAYTYFNNSINDFYVGAKLFNNVWHNYKKDSTFGDNKHLHIQQDYYNDSIGFIKKSLYYKNDKINKNEVWELQRCHLVK